MNSSLYDKRCQCLTCDFEFTSKKVRSNKMRNLHHDSDLCTYFAGVIPYYYEVNVCPNCGFAFTDSFAPLMTEQKKQIYAEYAPRYLTQGIPDLTGARDEDEALLSFKLALGSGFVKTEQPKLLAGISMRIAWLHRMAGRETEEQEFLAAANRFFHVAYETERDRASDAHYLHMLGDTSLRLGNLDDARQWFSQLFSPTHAGYVHLNLVRETWAARRKE